MFVHSLITLSTLYIVHGQNFQPRCQEFCFDGELADKNGVCVDGSSLVPLLSAEGYNIRLANIDCVILCKSSS